MTPPTQHGPRSLNSFMYPYTVTISSREGGTLSGLGGWMVGTVDTQGRETEDSERENKGSGNLILEEQQLELQTPPFSPLPLLPLSLPLSVSPSETVSQSVI